MYTKSFPVRGFFPAAIRNNNNMPQKHTSRRVGTEASRVLRNPRQPKVDRSVAGSALSQRPKRKK